MNSRTEPLDGEYNSYHDFDLMRCIGMSPRTNDQEMDLEFHSPKHIGSKAKAFERIEIKRSSMTVASQKMFSFERPAEAKVKQRDRITFGYFLDKEAKRRFIRMPSIVERKSGLTQSSPNIEIAPQFTNLKLKSPLNSPQSMTDYSQNAQRLLRLKERLRRSNLFSRQTNSQRSRNTNPNHSPQPSNNPSPSPPHPKDHITPINFYLQSIQQFSTAKKEKMTVIKNHKKNHLLKRKLNSKVIDFSWMFPGGSNRFTPSELEQKQQEYWSQRGKREEEMKNASSMI